MSKSLSSMRSLLNLWAWCVVFLLLWALLASGAHAQALPVGVSPVFAPSVSGNTVTYSGGTATAANASSLSFPPPANGPVYAQSTQSLNVGDGKSVPVTVRSRPSPAAIGKAVGNFAAKVVGVLTIGKALYDLCNELGYNCARATETGPITFTKPDPTACTVGPCYYYRVYNYNGGNFEDVFTSLSAAQSWWESRIQKSNLAAGNPPIVFTWNRNGDSWIACENGGCYYAGGVQAFAQRAPDTAVSQPATLQDLADAIAAKSGWPSSSAITRVLPEAIAAGEPLPLPSPYQITGPSEVLLPPSITSWPDGSTVTDTRKKNLSYGPDSVTVTDTSTKTQTAPNGVTTPVSTTTVGQPLPSQPTTAAATPEIQTCGYPGGPACKIDETGTPEALPKGEYLPSLDEYKAKADENRTTIGGNGDKPFFTGWNLFFFAPALAPCEPMTLPDFQGRPMGQLDACNVVDGTRSVMSYIWALGALFLCLGMIKKVV